MAGLVQAFQHGLERRPNGRGDVAELDDIQSAFAGLVQLTND
ncbi:hypothetical protein [Mycobacterium sp. Marseille-P9652]|nr:hypothetical protein [Mycobacterium sp. Marseille-P9652]